MKKVFVEGLSNEVKFSGAVARAERRGSPEAGWIIVESTPGLGKSRMLQRYAVLENHPHVRAKEAWTPNACLRDICIALNLTPQSRTIGMLDDIITLLQRMQPNPPKIIVDELNIIIKRKDILNQLRDITDIAEVMLIAGANNGAYAALNRDEILRSRVAEVVYFTPLSDKDMQVVCNALAEVKIGEDLQHRILVESRGEIRQVRNMIAEIETRMRNCREVVTLAKWENRPLLPSHKAQLKVVAGNG
jgi:hypothetical protein